MRDETNPRFPEPMPDGEPDRLGEVQDSSLSADIHHPAVQEDGTGPASQAQADAVKTAVAGSENFDLVELEDEVLDNTADRSYSQGQLVLRRFLRHKGAMISLVVLIGIIVLAFTSLGFGPIPGWYPHSYITPMPIENGGAPTISWSGFGTHPFGQDNVGVDYFALVKRGTQKSIIIALIVGLVSTAIGTAIGAIAGYFRGWTEAILMRITDLFIVIPMLVLAAVIGQMVGGGGIVLLAVMLGLLSWTGLARLVRGEVLSLREREFVSAARAVGAPPSRIIVRHILPNALGTIIVSATLSIASAILLETSLSYLGFGVRAPETSLGLLINNYQQTFSTRPWLFFAPAAMILAIALSINFIGDGLRDAFDPRQKAKV
ncbi:peptide/nickel transport system permease protein [Trueperella bonasi]|uniref:Peptide/nickel transport system permease protein n=1 Tax=Trueperella bonasi TaxID=312286 RepID=A0ABT9NGG2_9ACTO|nr:ABC transporter permease [Trueperella bonasi]MDP9806429.1 peptide/nickel transport system permease protein [Trueperella bonasi]